MLTASYTVGSNTKGLAMAENAPPKLHIDSDWKAEAQKERERLAQKEQERSAKPGPGARGERGEQELPEASFRTLVSMLASQAIMGLGAMADPQTNRVIIDLEGAKLSIDLLDVLELKTKGNLDEEEAKELRHMLAELRNRFVQITQLVARQMSAQQAGGGAGGASANLGAVPGNPSPMPPLRTQ
jgi:hypothetical protein